MAGGLNTVLDEKEMGLSGTADPLVFKKDSQTQGKDKAMAGRNIRPRMKYQNLSAEEGMSSFSLGQRGVLVRGACSSRGGVGPFEGITGYVKSEWVQEGNTMHGAKERLFCAIFGKQKRTIRKLRNFKGHMKGGKHFLTIGNCDTKG